MNRNVMVSVCLAFITGTFALFPALAMPPGVNLEVLPLSLKPLQGKSLYVVIVVRNTDKDLQDINLSWITDVNDLKVVLKEGQLKVNKLEKGASYSWLAGVSKETEDPQEGQVIFRLAYTSGRKAGVALSKLEIKPRASPEMDKIAELTIFKSTLQTLQEYKPGIILLLLKNKSDFPLTITSLAPQPQKSITLTPPELGAGLLLKPRESRTLKGEAKPTDQAYPGKYLLVFESGLKWEESGVPKTGRLVASHEVEVGVAGESEVLKLLGVPSFLLLPGFLMVTCAIWIRKRFPPMRAANSEVKTAEFWLLAITLSIAAALLYPVITRLSNHPRNYLVGYGLGDVIWVWCFSIVIGGLMGLVWAFAARRMAPSALDSPKKILRKLWLARETYPPARVEIKVGSETFQGFALREYGGGKRWVSPAIRWQWHPDKLRAFKDHQQFAKELYKVRGYGLLCWKFWRAEKGNRVLEVDWKKTGAFQGLMLANEDDLQPSGGGAYYEEDQCFSEKDSPMMILDKLALAGFTPIAAQWKGPGSHDIPCFIISGPWDGKRWIIPTIFFYWGSDDANTHQGFLASLDRVQTPQELADLMAEGQSKQWVRQVFWKPGDFPESPLLADNDKLTESKHTLKIVEEEVL